MHDIKIKRIVRKLKTDLNHVVGAWCVLLCLANDSPTRGRLLINSDTPMTVDDIAEVMGIDVAFAQRWIDEFKEAQMIVVIDEIICINNWGKRQFESDNSTARVQKFRQQQKKRDGNVSETPMKQNETPPDTDTDTEAYILPDTPEVETTDEVDLDTLSPIQLLDLLYPGMGKPFCQKKYASWEPWVGEQRIVELCKSAITHNLGNDFVSKQIRKQIDDQKNKPTIQLKQGGQAQSEPDDPNNPYNVQGKEPFLWGVDPKYNRMVKLPAWRAEELGHTVPESVKSNGTKAVTG